MVGLAQCIPGGLLLRLLRVRADPQPGQHARFGFGASPTQYTPSLSAQQSLTCGGGVFRAKVAQLHFTRLLVLPS